MTTLVIIFNHNYEANIDKILKLYNKKFNDIIILMPFSTIQTDNVVRVIGNSHKFYGYINYAKERILRNNSDYYLFIGDDLILNPEINSSNLMTFFNISQGKNYIKEIIPVQKVSFHWPHLYNSINSFESKGFEYANLLPDRASAIESLTKLGLLRNEISKLKVQSFFSTKDPFQKKNFSYYRALESLFYLVTRRKFKLPYPLIISYSDLFIVSKENIKQVINLFDIFSSMNLFAEVAVPLSLSLSVSNPKNLIFEKDLNGFKGIEYWSKKDIDLFCKKWNYDLDSLLGKWNTNIIYIHPIKLSKWK